MIGVASFYVFLKGDISKNIHISATVDICSIDWYTIQGLKENSIAQKGYRNNPLNQKGTAPKVVDPTTPGTSYELPAPWIEWLEEYSSNGRIVK